MISKVISRLFHSSMNTKVNTVIPLSIATPAFVCFMLLSPLVQAQNLPSVQRNAQFTEEGTDGCLRCHSGEKMRAAAKSPHGNLNHPSAPFASGSKGCESCHGPGSIHISRAHGGQGFPQLLIFGSKSDAASRSAQIDSCLSCHSKALGSTPAIEFRGGVHDKKKVNCSSCHLAHAETDPISKKSVQSETCYNCHTTTQAKHPRFEDKSINFDALSCWTCHDVHIANEHNSPQGVK